LTCFAPCDPWPVLASASTAGAARPMSSAVATSSASRRRGSIRIAEFMPGIAPHDCCHHMALP
jgi:hypothetical protein